MQWVHAHRRFAHMLPTHDAHSIHMYVHRRRRKRRRRVRMVRRRVRRERRSPPRRRHARCVGNLV